MQGFPGGSVVKNPPAYARDAGLIPELGRSLGGGNGYPLQYSCLGNLMDRGACMLQSMGRKESDTTEQLSMHAQLYTYTYINIHTQNTHTRDLEIKHYGFQK